jgi:hypothetical protein
MLLCLPKSQEGVKRQPHSPLLQNNGEYMWTTSDYNNDLPNELSQIKANCPPFSNVILQEKALRKLDIAIVSRGLILIKMIVQKKIKTPKDWLFARLHGLDMNSISLFPEICQD